MWEKKYFTPSPSIINGYKETKGSRKKKNEIKEFKQTETLETDLLERPNFFQRIKKTRAHLLFQHFLSRMNLQRVSGKCLHPIRPTTIKGKFTVGKGKYVNKVYSSCKHQAF